MLTPKSSEDAWYKMSRTSGAGGQFQDPGQFRGPIDFS
jgi:hypothetical protein